MSLATINDHAVSIARVQVGAWGAWWADVSLPDPIELAGAVSLVIADVTLSGTVISGGVANGNAAYRVAGGRGGWGKTVPRKGYPDDQGTKAAKVLSEAAAAVGESVAGLPANRLGPHYVRAEGPASRVLNDVAPRAWRVDFDGVTRFGARPTIAYTGTGARTKIDPQGSIVEIATETLAQLVPGATIDGSAPATDVEYLLDAKRLTARVYAGRRSSRRLDALSRTIEALFPEMRWSGAFEFRVVSQTLERFDLQPVRTGTGLPDLRNVPVRGPAGVKATVTPGELVGVAFMDRDPSRPFIFCHDAPDGPGWMPLFLLLGSEPQLGVARQTDPVVCGAFGGTIVGASLRVKAGL